MNRLAQLRKEKGYTQDRVAKELGIKVRTYRSYESGDRGIDSDKITLFSDYFGVSADYLLGRSDNRNEEEEIADVMQLRQTMRERPDIAFLMDLARNGKASDVLQASALLQRLKEESENK